jgi:apolipoprotein N-acyltransferase
MIKKSGYLWKCYGFTMTHMWGLHLVSGAMAVVGVGMLTFAILGISTLEQNLFYRLLAGSAVVMLADIAMILYSLFSIHFYRFATQISNNEEPNKPVPHL